VSEDYERVSGEIGRSYRHSFGAKIAGTIVLISLFCLWPLAFLGYPTNADDTFWHFIYIEGFFRDLAAGEVYPRWIADADGGLGAATFYFYGPMAYYITSAVALVTGARDGLTMLAASTPLFLIGSGLTAFIWLRVFLPVSPALVGAALYIAAPYHLMIDYWMRGAFAEAAAYIWVPLIFRAVEDFRVGAIRRGTLLLPIALALLATTHVMVTVLALAVVALYAVVRLRLWRTWIFFGLAGAAGLAMAAIYLVPMVALQGYVTVPYVPLENWVFVLGPRASAPAPDGASVAQVFATRPLSHILDLLFLCEAAALVVLGVFVYRSRQTAYRSMALFWTALTGALLLSTLVWFAPLWRIAPVYNEIQFPQRVNSITDLALATAGALFVGSLELKRSSYIKILVVIAGFGAAQALMPIAGGKFDVTKRDWNAIRQIRDVRDAFRPLASLGQLSFDQDPRQIPNIPKVATSQGEVRVEVWKPGSIVIDVTMKNPGPITIGQLWIPLWQAQDADGHSLSIYPSDNGLIQFTSPAGQHRIVVRLATSAAEWLGVAVSAVGLLIWIALIIFAQPISYRLSRC
jgi:hypothetical protein